MVILAYHRVGGRTDTSTDLPTEQFVAQMELLAGSGRVITLEAALSRLDATSGPIAGTIAGQITGPNPVVVTFDDGTADWVDEVLPVLVATGVPATFYVATGFVDDDRSFPGAGVPLGWSGLREMTSTPLVSIGSHTHTHLLLDRTDHATAAGDLQRSIDRIGEELGVTVRDFAYPKALDANRAVQPAVRARFRSAVLAGNRTNPVGADRYRLGRHPVQRSHGLEAFASMLDGGGRLVGSVRERVLPLRERGSVT